MLLLDEWRRDSDSLRTALCELAEPQALAAWWFKPLIRQSVVER